jgi:uncharacterized protein
MIAVSAHAEGSLLPVRAQPGARRTAVAGEHDGALKVAVTAPAQDGRANEAVRETICGALKLKRGQVELIQGAASRRKVFLVRGVSKEELERRLAGILQP